MTKTVSALVFVLVLLGVHPLFALEIEMPTAVGALHGQAVAKTAAAGAHDGRSSSLAALAIADTASHAQSRDASGSADVPFATGAWLMGAGLVAFIICRKRFKN